MPETIPHPKWRLFFIATALLGCMTIVACAPSGPSSESGDSVVPTERLKVQSALGNPRIDPVAYRLRVEGLVQRPLSLSLEQIRAMPSIEEEVVMTSMKGWSQKARWKGVSLSIVLEAAGVDRERAERILFFGAEGYETSLLIQDAAREGVLLAYEVNGESLPRKHGYPLRLVARNKYGYKWIKWVVRIKAIAGDHRGYWELFGYDNQGEVIQK